MILVPGIRSYSIMFPYSRVHQRQSILHKEDIKVQVPGCIKTSQKDWFPFMIYFTDNDGFSRFIGEKAYFTVMYNFGAFDRPWSHSVYYDSESPYYSSFYG